MQVYNMKQAQADIESVYSMGLFDDVNIMPSPAEESTADAPKVPPFRHATAHLLFSGSVTVSFGTVSFELTWEFNIRID